MKIKGIELIQLDFELREPYTIAYETVDRVANFVLRLETSAGDLGWGCAAPDQVVTGESTAMVQEAFATVVEPLLRESDNAFGRAAIMAALEKALPHHASCRAMVDMALHDLVARKAGLPLYQTLGGYRRSIATSITIGILDLEQTLEKVRAYQQQGFRILKIKGGLDVEADIEKMVRIREEVGPDFGLRFDANQGYSVAQALEFVQGTQKCGVEILEQPTPIGANRQLGEVTKASPIPVMADESLKSLSDAFRLVQQDLVDMVNIKLMKVGGLASALHINSVARSAGLEAMVGCLDECGLGISAGLHFALARPNVEFADLDGHLDLIGDPFARLCPIENGIMYPLDEPGLGNIPKL